MATMIREVYEALKEAGASEVKAIAAAETLAGHKNRLQRLERRLTILTWMVGTNIILTGSLLVAFVGWVLTLSPP